MKTKLILLTLVSTLALSARARWTVIDPALIKQDALFHKEDIGKFQQMIDNQNQQITILTQQLAQLTFLAQVLGNPLTNTTLAGGDSVLQCLGATGVDQSRSDIVAMSTAALALAEDALGLYRAVGGSYQTYDGKSANRDANAYKAFAALSGATANHDAVADDVKERRQRLRAAMRDTMLKITQANTTTEVQKLQAVMSAQFAELEAADKELDFATSKALVQDIENRNDQQKQAVARREEQAAEMSASMNRVSEALRPDTKPLRLSK